MKIFLGFAQLAFVVVAIGKFEVNIKKVSYIFSFLYARSNAAFC